MHIREVVSYKDVADFHNVPFSIYKNDDNWIPHIKQDIEKVKCITSLAQGQGTLEEQSSLYDLLKAEIKCKLKGKL